MLVQEFMELNKERTYLMLLKGQEVIKKMLILMAGILARKSVAEKEKIAFMKSADQLEQSIATAISSGRISSVGGDPTICIEHQYQVL